MTRNGDQDTAIKELQQQVKTHEEFLSRSRMVLWLAVTLGLSFSGMLALVWDKAKEAKELASSARNEIAMAIGMVRDAAKTETDQLLVQMREEAGRLTGRILIAAESRPGVGYSVAGPWDDLITEEGTFCKAALHVPKGALIKVDASGMMKWPSWSYYKIELLDGSAEPLLNPERVTVMPWPDGLPEARGWDALHTASLYKSTADGNVAFGVRFYPKEKGREFKGELRDIVVIASVIGYEPQ